MSEHFVHSTEKMNFKIAWQLANNNTVIVTLHVMLLFV